MHRVDLVDRTPRRVKFVSGFALGDKGREKCALLQVGLLVLQHVAKHRVGRVAVEVAAGDQLLDVCAEILDVHRFIPPEIVVYG